MVSFRKKYHIFSHSAYLFSKTSCWKFKYILHGRKYDKSSFCHLPDRSESKFCTLHKEKNNEQVQLPRCYYLSAYSQGRSFQFVLPFRVVRSAAILPVKAAYRCEPRPTKTQCFTFILACSHAKHSTYPEEKVCQVLTWPTQCLYRLHNSKWVFGTFSY